MNHSRQVGGCDQNHSPDADPWLIRLADVGAFVQQAIDRMIQKILAFIESANFKNARRQGRLACPACGAAPTTMPSEPDDVNVCAKCGTAASALECSQPTSAQQLARGADERPAGTQITREADSQGTVTWNIPASGKSGGLMFFALFWCGFTGILTAAVLFGRLERGGSLASLGWLVAFFALFWAVGLSFLYAACRSKYARHRLTADPTAVTLRRELFGRQKEMRVPTGTVQSIAAVEFYQRNYQPVHGIEIRALNGKLRFGSMLSEEEKAWLVADLRRAVFGNEPAVQPGVVIRPAPMPARDEHFSVPMPIAPSRLLVPGVSLLVIGVAFILIGIFVIDGDLLSPRRESGSPVGAMFDFLFGSFRILWIGMASIFAAIGIALLTRYGKTRHQKTSLEGTRSAMVLRTTQAGRIVHQREFPKEEFVDVRASRVGSSNGKSTKRIELLIGRKAHMLARWIDGEKADEFVARARQALRPGS